MPNVHRIESRVAELPVNAYLIEGERELVAVEGRSRSPAAARCVPESTRSATHSPPW
jgi:hypothetical protein